MVLSLCFYALLFSVAYMSISEAHYEFTIRFYEFHNPLGLQCGACESGGPPACCDDLRQDNCVNTPPRTCDTRFRYLLRPFGASVETAPTGGFPYFTPLNGGNSETFNEGDGEFLGVRNPFTIITTSKWTGRIQFFIDALDRAVPSSGLSETEAFINRFPINLELQPGPVFTGRVNYTGIYNISGVTFDISFRVQCSENYYGPNCTTLCVPLQGVYSCDSEGRFICIEDNRDPITNCSSCLDGYNPLRNCLQCLQGRDVATNCTTCLPGYDPLTNSTECLPDVQLKPTQGSPAATTISNSLLTPEILGGILGGILGLSVIISILLLIIVVALLITKMRATALLPPSSVNEEDNKGTKDIQMKPNAVYGLISGSESMLNEVDGVSVPGETTISGIYEYINS